MQTVGGQVIAVVAANVGVQKGNISHGVAADVTFNEIEVKYIAFIHLERRAGLGVVAPALDALLIVALVEPLDHAMAATGDHEIDVAPLDVPLAPLCH